MPFGSKPARKRILIVEDDWAVLEVLKLMLEDEGYSVVTAKHGKEGLAASASRRFDLVLMDISMPGMSGIEVAQAMRAQVKTGDVLIAIHTGLDEHWVRERFTDYDLFLTKAADTDVLVDKIRTLFREPPVRRTAQDAASGEPTFGTADAARAQQALRDAMEMGPESLSLKDLMGRLATEIDQLRRLGKTDAEIAKLIGDAVGQEVPLSALVDGGVVG